MFTIEISGEKLDEGVIDAGWIARHIRGAQASGRNPCVKFHFEVDGQRSVLASCGCARGVGGRRPNDLEQKLLDLWAENGLDECGFEPGAVISFANRAKNLV